MSLLRKTLFCLFFLSGFCGLLYQVIWMRLAFASFGVITPVLSVVVSIFMLGLALGSWAGGVWISKTAATRTFSAIFAYAAVEGFIGLGAFIVPKLYPLGMTLLLPSGELNSASYLFFSGLIIALSILPWCVLMGATFPLMMAFLKEQESSTVTSFSFLYLANVIGAMCGTILTADVLVELLGFKHTLLVAGVCNFLIAGVSLVLGDRFPLRTGGEAERKTIHLETPRLPISAKASDKLFLILFATGFTSMSLEVIWVRNFTCVLGTSIYAFALIVAVYLLATWLGSSAYRLQADIRRITPVASLMASLSVATLFTIVINDPRLHLSQPGVLIGIFPFCFLLGYLTPCLIDLYSQGDPDRAGRAYAVNIVGCILGPLLASYLFLPLLGAKGSLILMALPYIGLFAAQFKEEGPRWKHTAAVLTGGMLLCALLVNRSYEEQFKTDIVRRDATATVISYGTGMEKHLLVNGVGITQLTTITKIMAHFPLLMLDHPKSALDICFGMGTTYRSLLCWPGLKVTAVELVPSVKKAFGYYHANAADVMANPNGRVVIDDGRRFLRRTSETFDLITLDPPPPIEAAGSSLLYATEFYDLVKQRLTPNGILQQWFPGGPGVECQAIVRSVTLAFPYVRVFVSVEGWGVHIIASMKPIQIPRVQRCLDLMPAAAEKDLLEWEPEGTTTQNFLNRIMAREVPVSYVLAGNEGTAISDDRPFNEYYLLRRSWAHNQKVWNEFWSRIRAKIKGGSHG